MLALFVLTLALERRNQIVRADGAQRADAGAALSVETTQEKLAQRAGAGQGVVEATALDKFIFRKEEPGIPVYNYAGNSGWVRSKGGCPPGLPDYGEIAVGERRGMYVALDQFKEPAAASYILGDADKEQQLLTFCFEHGINVLTLYEMHEALDPSNGEKRAQLQRFVRKAREWGIASIEIAAGAERGPEGPRSAYSSYHPEGRDRSFASNTWGRIRNYNENSQICERFDGGVTNLEYWRNAAEDVTELTDALAFIKTIDIPGGVYPFRLSAYVGLVSNEDMAAICGSSFYQGATYDEIWLRVFANDPAEAPRRVQERRDACAQTHSTARFVTVLSAEGDKYAEDEATTYEHLGSYMYDWMQQHAQHTSPLDHVERRYKDHAPVDASGRFHGFQWYAYHFARWHIQESEGEHALDRALEPVTSGQR